MEQARLPHPNLPPRTGEGAKKSQSLRAVPGGVCLGFPRKRVQGEPCLEPLDHGDVPDACLYELLALGLVAVSGVKAAYRQLGV